MDFRTAIEPMRHMPQISMDDNIVMLGSCFTDNIGARLETDGFKVAHNPMGPLYNPASLARLIERSLSARIYGKNDFITGCDNMIHCLDFASRYQAHDIGTLEQMVNTQFRRLCDDIGKASVLIVTFGTAWIFRHRGRGEIVGNCHKFPAGDFERSMMTIEEIVTIWRRLLNIMPPEKRIIFTISPIRHLGDGHHGNQLSKSTLLIAVERLLECSPNTVYFPAYEIMMDDLRDYRFYATDMKHPSDVAVSYIYEIFSRSFFSQDTLRKAEESRKTARQSAHKPILAQ